MSEQLDTHRHESHDFSWEQVGNELDYAAAGNELEDDSVQLLTSLADDIKSKTEAGFTIQGTDEYIPGSTTYYRELADEEGNVTTEEVPADIAKRVIEFGHAKKQEDAEKANWNDFLERVGKISEENPDRPDLVLDKLGLSQSELNNMGYTRLSELQSDAAPVYASRKVQEEEAAKQAAYDKRVADQRDHFEKTVAINKAAAEERRAKQEEAERDEKVAAMTSEEIEKLSFSELAELAGVKYSDVLKGGKESAIKSAQKRIAERRKANEGSRAETEEKQNEYAALLADFDRQSRQAALDAQRSPEDNSDGDDTEITSGADLDNPVDPVVDPVDAGEPTDGAGDTANDEPRNNNRTLRQRIRDRMTQIYIAATTPNALGRVLEKRETLTRKQKLGLAAGGIAVIATAAYIAHKTGVTVRGGNNTEAAADLLNGTDSGGNESMQIAADMLTGNRPSSGGNNLSNAADMLSGHDIAPPAPVSPTPESLGIDVGQYSWNVAHELAAGKENEVMQAAIDKYNELHGTGFALTPKGSSTWIMDGARAINPTEQAELNSLMTAL